ncbi:MAG: prevent-host-death protein [Rhodoglobus sp.]|jgi:prevent-host-death family protein|nr:prevent-host-death protein [Rhodoglobus sp.]
MSEIVSLYEAKTHLSELGERAAGGEEIVVTKHGKPRFRIVALEEPKRRPAPGAFASRFTDEEKKSLDEHDWFAPDEEIERLFGMRE